MNITEYAMFKKMSGGGGGKREGTAIKAGEVYEKIYFNTNNTSAETANILSQLTYVDAGLGDPVYPVYANTSDGENGTFLFIMNFQNGFYQIMEAKSISTMDGACYFINDSDHSESNGWCYWIDSPSIDVPMLVAGIPVIAYGISLTDLQGLPIGAENDKLKNVISATPF